MEAYLRPYLIIPKLIQQPTWGGEYIGDLKNFTGKPFMQGLKIGQSYELFSDTKLFLPTDAEAYQKFMPEIGYPDSPSIVANLFTLSEHKEYITLQDLIVRDPEEIIGPQVLEKHGKMPLLIKINHAKGNSFQLHIKSGVLSDRWQPKPESWYYLEKGLLTYGIRKGISIPDYKAACIFIDKNMQLLSGKIINKSITLESAREEASKIIKRVNPWQYVNTVQAEKYDIFDLSAGGLHHSWEEDSDKLPIGNVLYEVQYDKMDPVSTIRCFDQGKIKDDGSIRELNIDDYFTYLDTDEERNTIEYSKKAVKGGSLMTGFYAMDVIEVSKEIIESISSSFVHLYARDGEVAVSGGNYTIDVKKGYSCFIPYGLGSYTISPKTNNSVVLKTYIPGS